MRKTSLKFSKNFKTKYFLIIIKQNSLENLEKENEFLRTQCKSYEKQLEDLQKENQKLSENLSKTYEELELYKSIFLVKNLEIKYQPIKANILKSSNNNHHPKYFSNEKPLTPLKFDQKSINIEIPPYEDNDLEKFQENKTKNLTNDSFLFRFLDLYEKFKVFFMIFLCFLKIFFLDFETLLRNAQI